MAHLKALRSSLFSPLSCLLLPWPSRISRALPRTGSLPNRAITILRADLLARSALDIVVSDLKQEIANSRTVTQTNIQPQRSGDDASIPNLIRRSVRNDAIPAPASEPGLAVSSGPVDPTNPKRGEITSARWNSHYLIPTGWSTISPHRIGCW